AELAESELVVEFDDGTRLPGRVAPPPAPAGPSVVERELSRRLDEATRGLEAERMERQRADAQVARLREAVERAASRVTEAERQGAEARQAAADAGVRAAEVEERERTARGQLEERLRADLDDLREQLGRARQALVDSEEREQVQVATYEELLIQVEEERRER